MPSTILVYSLRKIQLPFFLKCKVFVSISLIFLDSSSGSVYGVSAVKFSVVAVKFSVVTSSYVKPSSGT